MSHTTAKTKIFNLGNAQIIPLGEGRTFQAGSRSVAVFRLRSGELYATQANCPHRDGPLAEGMVGAGKVICPLHAYKFDLATGQPVGNDCSALRTFPVSSDDDGTLWLRIESEDC